jgi:hypothetical protein
MHRPGATRSRRRFGACGALDAAARADDTDAGNGPDLVSTNVSSAPSAGCTGRRWCALGIEAGRSPDSERT